MALAIVDDDDDVRTALSRLLLAGLAYPGFLFLGLISTWRAIGRHVARRQTWAKTERLAEEPVPTAV